MSQAQVEYSLDGHVAHLVLNNPARFNAIGPRLAGELVDALQQASADEQVRVVLLTGAGKAFCAGGDLDFFESGPAGCGSDMAGLVRAMGAAAMLIRTMPKPVVAAVHRVAAGAGLGLALLSDFCLAAEDATFSTAFIRLGLVPDTGVGFVLARTLGHSRACDLLMSGRTFTAAQAKDWGLISEVVPAAELSRAAEGLAAGLVTGPVGAFAGIKEQLMGAAFAGFAEHLEREVAQQAARAACPDLAEGLRAFREKHAPNFLTPGHR